LGALEYKFWSTWCNGVGRPDLIEHQGAAPGTDGADQVEAVFLERTRAEWTTFADEHDCCLEPILSPAESFARAAADAGELPPTIDAVGPTGEPIPVPAPGLRFSRSPLATGGAAPRTGAHQSAATDPDSIWPTR
ncbi:MAG: CoA transferase, partial [Solirubrobacteraceae bacterium]|nr:CoA transferase [Solirubrobacteraceae bacterium]